MKAATRTRRRPTETMREAGRLSTNVAESLARVVRAGRVRLRLTQAQLGARVGIHQSGISRIELGRGRRVRLTQAQLGVALGRTLAIYFTKPLGEMREPADAGHLAMQERLLERARHGQGHVLRAADSPGGSVPIDRRLRPRPAPPGAPGPGSMEHVR